VLADRIENVPELTGNLVHDAHTAALMFEHGARTIYIPVTPTPTASRESMCAILFATTEPRELLEPAGGLAPPTAFSSWGTGPLALPGGVQGGRVARRARLKTASSRPQRSEVWTFI
jgi:hypothetical protein